MSEKPIATHVDDWLDKGVMDVMNNPDTAYARFVLVYARMPAWMQSAFSPWMSQFKLFCTYKDGKRYRVTGASRMGDVWLASDHEKTTGYDLRVNVDDCQQWGDKP